MHAALPLIVLAGSDRRPSELPEAALGKHVLTGYKGVDVRVGGSPLVAVVAERFLASGGFGPVYVAGPETIYHRLDMPATLVPTDGSFGANIRAALDHVRRLHPGSRFGLTTCDILPDPADLRRVLARLADDEPADVWFPIVPVEDGNGLGASAWKPSYRLVVGPERRRVRVLPGHLAVADATGIRKVFMERVLDLGYRTRNRSVLVRRAAMIRGLAAAFLASDLRAILAGRLPRMIAGVMAAAFVAGRQLAGGELTLERLEAVADLIFFDDAYRRAHPTRRLRIPLIDAPSLALDIDTEEEARERGADVGPALR